MKIYTLIIYSLLLAAGIGNTSAAAKDDIRWHNAESDSITINKILLKASEKENQSMSEMICSIGKEFLGKPYKSGTLESDEEILTVNLDEFDCTTYMETVVALALTARSEHYSWKDFAQMLSRLRYRNEVADGYASRLHYISDWVITNSHRGLIRDVTSFLPTSDSQIKTIDFMSRNREKYPALKDSLQLSRIKEAESGYKSHRYSYMKSSRIYSKPVANSLISGDIIAFTTKVPGLDVSHVGIIVVEKDGPHLMHASSKEGKIIVEPRPLEEYLKKNQHITGFRIFRPVE